MTYTAGSLVATIAPSSEFPGRLDVSYDGVRVGTVKDGGHIVKNADRVLRANGVLRTAGYTLDEDRALVATAIRLIVNL